MELSRKDFPNKYILIIDLCCILVSFLLSTWIRYGGKTSGWVKNIYGVAFVIVILLYIAIYSIYDTCSKLFKRGFLLEMIAVIKINFILAAAVLFVLFILQQGKTYSRLFFLTFFILNILITYIVRQYFKRLFLSIYKKSGSSSKLMIITTSDHARSVLDRIQKENDWKYQVNYLTILDKCLIGQQIEGIPVKADFMNMFEVAKKEVLDGVFIHIPGNCPLNFDLEETILEFENMGIVVNLSINTFGLKVHEKVVREISGYHVLTFSTRLFAKSQLQLKRFIDILGGIIGSLITIILLILVGLVIKLESPGPIFFSQIRVGKNGRRFKIYKFRSMYIDAEERKAELMDKNEMNGFMFKIKDDPRITKVGKLIRMTSIDEFPQFFNILKGDMSLVGTRPPTEEEFLQYERRHKRRLTLKCGLTGLWQVSGRNNIKDFEDIVKMDLEYIDNWSIMLDIKILIKTIGVVLFRIGSR